jgi:hypothetical protein
MEDDQLWPGRSLFFFRIRGREYKCSKVTRRKQRLSRRPLGVARHLYRQDQHDAPSQSDDRLDSFRVLAGFSVPLTVRGKGFAPGSCRLCVDP